jgi:DNA modification methylase
MANGGSQQLFSFLPATPAASRAPTDDPAQEKQAKEVDPRNSLNELNGSEWLPETKSFFFQKGLGSRHPHAEIEREHPAPFSFQDVQRLIEFFTKSGAIVFDPFSGVGSTAKACALANRRSVSIELSPRWHQLAKERLVLEVPDSRPADHVFMLGDVREKLTEIPQEAVDFIVTSPPYWSILNKKPDHKAMERVRKDLATSYSEDDRDLGNIEDYEQFIAELAGVFFGCASKLVSRGYFAIVVTDFRHQSRFYPFHSDLIQALQDRPCQPNGDKLRLQGIKILLQNHKSLKPYGYPFAYVENIHHHYILIFRKDV